MKIFMLSWIKRFKILLMLQNTQSHIYIRILKLKICVNRNSEINDNYMCITFPFIFCIIPFFLIEGRGLKTAKIR